MERWIRTGEERTIGIVEEENKETTIQDPKNLTTGERKTALRFPIDWFWTLLTPFKQKTRTKKKGKGKKSQKKIQDLGDFSNPSFNFPVPCFQAF